MKTAAIPDSGIDRLRRVRAWAAAGFSSLLPRSGQRHPRDISAEALSAALEAAARPDLLTELVGTARRSFGFFPDHHHHTIGGPWVARLLEDVPQGSRVLDVGAGLSALPVFLAESGQIVDCVDSHPIVRTPPPTADWNEWGFFDYARLHANLRAHHCPIAEFVPPHRFDVIYSVAVFAHLSASERRMAFLVCRNLLRPGRTFLATLDLIPGTELLWNTREGSEVELAERHGGIIEVRHELADLGFRIEELRVHRMVPRSRTDLLFVRCVLNS